MESGHANGLGAEQRWWDSLSAKLMLAFLVLSIIPMAAAASYTLTQCQDGLSDLANQNLVELSRSTANSIEGLLIENQWTSATLAGEAVVVQFMSASEGERKTLHRRVYQTLQNFAHTHPDYDAPGLLDANGIVVASLEETLMGEDRSFRDYFQESIRGQSYISSMLVGHRTGRAGVFLAHPIITPESEIVGVSIVWLKGPVIRSMIDEVTVGEEGFAYLIDQDGVIIAHPDRNLWYNSLTEIDQEASRTFASSLRFGTVTGSDAPLLPRSLGLDDLAVELASGQTSGTLRYYSSSDQQDHIAGYTRLEAVPWTVVVDSPEDQFMIPLQKARAMAFAGLCVVAMAALVISIPLTGAITRPIRRLTSAATSLQRGETFDPLAIEDVAAGRDETARLARAFGDMVLALRQSEQTARTLLNSPTDVAALVDTHGRILDVSDTLAARFGRSRDDMLGLRLQDLLPPDVAASRAERTDEVIRSGLPLRFEDERDGRWYDNVLNPILDAEGQVVQLAVTARDITERKHAEERTEHLNAVLRAIRTVNQLIVREKDRDRLLTQTCRSLIETRGYRSAWVALLDDNQRLVAAAEAGLGEAFQPLVEHLNLGDPSDCVREALERSESAVVQDPLSHCVECPLADAYAEGCVMIARLEHHGTIYGLLTASVPTEYGSDPEEISLFEEVAGDVALALHALETEKERQRAEAELRRRTEDLDERMRELGCLYGLSDLADRPDLAPEAILQRATNLIPLAWQYPEITCARLIVQGREFRTSAFQETAWKQHEDIVAGGEWFGTVEVCYAEERPARDEGPFLREERGLIKAIARRLGEILLARRASEALKTHSERLEEMVQERTVELRQAHERLVRQEKLAVLGQLAGGVGHELRNPLGVISNAAYYLRGFLTDIDETSREFLDLIATEVRNAEKIISDLLSFSRTRPAEFVEIAISELVDLALQKQPPPGDIRVSMHIDVDLPEVWVDPQQIGLVLGNLITNAYQAMPEGGELTIAARADDGVIRLSIGDTGSGITSDNMERLFEPLFTTKPRGIGLGLAVSRNLVELNGGTIDAESEEGAGATFAVTLPAREAAA